jgi:MSHA biogenesis protein MshM
MIKSNFGITKVPFFQAETKMLNQQYEIFNIINIHSQQGGLCVITGDPGVGKSIIKEHLEALNKTGTTTVTSFSRTMHTFPQILRQLALAMKIETKDKSLEDELIKAAFKEVESRKTLVTIIDEAHLLDMNTLRKLRLMFDRFPKKHNIVLFGQPELMIRLSMREHLDLKSRITFSRQMLPLDDQRLSEFMLSELDSVGLGANTFEEATTLLILRSVQGNLRLCCNLCYSSLLEAGQESERIVNTRHVNAVLVQPHWRSHDENILRPLKR